MADHWPTIRQNIAPDLILRAHDNFASWGYQKAAEMDIDEAEWIASESVKLAWRDRHPATRALWYACKDAMVLAIRNPGAVYKAGPRMQVGVVVRGDQTWMLIELPSGKHLTYFSPRVSIDDAITYMGYGSDDGGQRVWGVQYTYGGKAVENACQAVAGDVLKSAMPGIEAAGYAIVLTVHDETVTEAPDTPEYNADDLSRLLSIVPPWADGLPLAAAGFEAYRYKKED
jgi:DNA polymerase